MAGWIKTHLKGWTLLNTCKRILSIIPTQPSLNFSLTHTHLQVKSTTPLLETVCIRLNNLTVKGSSLPRCCPYRHSSRHWNANNESITRARATKWRPIFFHEKEPHISCFLNPIREGNLSGDLPRNTQRTSSRQTVSWPYKILLSGLTEFFSNALPSVVLNVLNNWRQEAWEGGDKKRDLVNIHTGRIIVCRRLPKGGRGRILIQQRKSNVSVAHIHT